MRCLLLALVVSAAGCSGSDDPPADTDDTDTLVDTDTDTDDTDVPPAETGDTGTGCPSPTSWFPDGDGDGYGDATGEVVACEAPTDHVADSTDCDDTDGTVNPAAVEICNGVDDDCDAATVEAGSIVTGGASFSSIQDAIDAAPAGATVEVCEGTFAEALRIDRDLTLRGMLGADLTTIDAGGQPDTSTVWVRSGVVVLEGLTLTGGTGRINDGLTWGGGLYTGSSGGVEVRDCIIEGNSADFGGGMTGTSLFPASDTLIDTVIRNNSAAFSGGGFVLFSADLQGVEVSGNDATLGGGGSAWYWTVAADPTTVITGNTADSGGGLYPWDDGTWTGGLIEANVASRRGGGVYVDDNVVLADVVVADNTAPCGGGMAVVGGATLTMSDSAFTGNQATACDGGAISVDEGSLTCTVCDLGVGATDNTPDDLWVTYGPMTWGFSGEAGETFSCSPGPSGCVGL